MAGYYDSQGRASGWSEGIRRVKGFANAGLGAAQAAGGAIVDAGVQHFGMEPQFLEAGMDRMHSGAADAAMPNSAPALNSFTREVGTALIGANNAAYQGVQGGLESMGLQKAASQSPPSQGPEALPSNYMETPAERSMRTGVVNPAAVAANADAIARLKAPPAVAKPSGVQPEPWRSPNYARLDGPQQQQMQQQQPQRPRTLSAGQQSWNGPNWSLTN